MCVTSAAIPCGNLSSPTNGQVSVEGNTLGSQANYSCSEGYVLNGNNIRMCQGDGQWSGSEPRCEGQVMLCVHAIGCMPTCTCVYVRVCGKVIDILCDYCNTFL